MRLSRALISTEKGWQQHGTPVSSSALKTPPPDGTSGGDVHSSGVSSDQQACGRRGAVVRPLSKSWEWVRADLALQLLIDLVWLVETSDVDGRSYLAWTWFRGRLRSARLDLD